MVRWNSAKVPTQVQILYSPHMVFIVLMVSTSVCGTDSMGSNPIKHPKCPYGGIGIRNGLRTRTIESSNLSTGTLEIKLGYMGKFSYICICII